MCGEYPQVETDKCCFQAYLSVYVGDDPGVHRAPLPFPIREIWIGAVSQEFFPARVPKEFFRDEFISKEFPVPSLPCVGSGGGEGHELKAPPLLHR